MLTPEQEKAIEAVRAYADVLEQHEEWKPVANQNQNGPVQITVSSNTTNPQVESHYKWVPMSDGRTYQLAQPVRPYEGFRTKVEEIIHEYRRRAGDDRSTGATEDSEYGTGPDARYTYSGTIATTASGRSRAEAARTEYSSRRSRYNRTSYPDSCLNTVHDQLHQAFGFRMEDEERLVKVRLELKPAAEVYGFRLQKKVILDEWLEPWLVPHVNSRLVKLRDEARCYRDHPAPDADCSCGFYSMAHPKYLESQTLKNGMMFGLVSQHWGKIIVGRDEKSRDQRLVQGYRSQWQQVLAVICKGISHTVKTQLERRDVEVYDGYDKIDKWWKDIGIRRFDGLVDDAAYRDVRWGSGGY